MTNGGLLGKLGKVDDNYVVVEIAENVEVKMQKVFRRRSAAQRHAEVYLI